MDNYKAVLLSPMRKAIASRMTEAQQTIPHFRLVVDVEVDALLGLRNTLRSSTAMRDVSINDLLIKACATALMDVPAVNIQWANDAIHQFSTADVSIVVSVEGGILTPIVHRANEKTVKEISREIADMTFRASKGLLKVNEIVGGSFTLSNLGMYGVDQFDAIINAPQCAILAIGSAKPRLVISAEGEPRAATLIRATLSVDHRAIDGVTAAKFAATLKRRVEDPSDLAVDVP